MLSMEPNSRLGQHHVTAVTKLPHRPATMMRDNADRREVHFPAGIGEATTPICLLAKKEEMPEDMESATRKKTLSHLRRYFDSIEVTSVQQVEPDK